MYLETSRDMGRGRLDCERCCVAEIAEAMYTTPHTTRVDPLHLPVTGAALRRSSHPRGSLCGSQLRVKRVKRVKGGVLPCVTAGRTSTGICTLRRTHASQNRSARSGSSPAGCVTTACAPASTCDAACALRVHELDTDWFNNWVLYT